MTAKSILHKTLRFFGWGGDFGGVYTGDGNLSYARSNAFSTTAGPPINETTALSIPAFLHAVRLYGSVIGSLEWDLQKWTGDRSRAIARNHPIHRLLHDCPNEFQTAICFRETLIGHAIVWGNGYTYIERDGNMRATALLPLLPDRTWATRVGGELGYTTVVNGQRKNLSGYEVLHLPGLSLNGLTGVPLVRIMAETLGLTKAEEQFAAAFFGHGANPGGIIKYPGILSEEARNNLRQSSQHRSGLGNSFRDMILEEGMDYTPNSIDAEKSQLVQTRQFQIGDLARIVGLPPHLLYDLSRSTNNNIEYQGIEAVTYSFGPWCAKLCQEANRKLLYESEKGIYLTNIDLKPLTRGDSLSQAQRDQARFNTASLTPNEIREKDGLIAIAGGDELFVNVATMPLALLVERVRSSMALQSAQGAAALATSVAAAAAAAVTPALGADPGPTAIDPNDAIGVDPDPAAVDAEPTPDPSAMPVPANQQPGPAVDPAMVEDVNVLGAVPNPQSTSVEK